jgi:hypothetical protein
MVKPYRWGIADSGVRMIRGFGKLLFVSMATVGSFSAGAARAWAANDAGLTPIAVTIAPPAVSAVAVVQGLTTEQMIYSGRALGWLVVPSLEPA